MKELRLIYSFTVFLLMVGISIAQTTSDTWPILKKYDA